MSGARGSDGAPALERRSATNAMRLIGLGRRGGSTSALKYVGLGKRPNAIKYIGLGRRAPDRSMLAVVISGLHLFP